MTAFMFRPAKRENVPVIVGVAGGTGSGKSMSAMEIATGLAGGKPFAVIDTEARRALAYADLYKFDHGELKSPFRPNAYAEAIAAADEAGYPVIVVDSASHEHAGEGGLLDMHDEELDRMTKGDDSWSKRERFTMAAWIKPKMEHKAFVQKLLQLRAHLVLCFRAEEKLDMVKVDGKTKIVPKEGPTGLHGWMPIAEKNLPYELTCSFLLLASNPGVPLPIKLNAQHRPFFPLDKPITRAAGEALARWGAGTGAASKELVSVLDSIARSGDVGELEGIAAEAAKLSDQDKLAAKNAYKLRHAQLTAKPKE